MLSRYYGIVHLFLGASRFLFRNGKSSSSESLKVRSTTDSLVVDEGSLAPAPLPLLVPCPLGSAPEPVPASVPASAPVERRHIFLMFDATLVVGNSVAEESKSTTSIFRTGFVGDSTTAVDPPFFSTCVLHEPSLCNWISLSSPVSWGDWRTSWK